MKERRPIPRDFNLNTARPPYPKYPYFSGAKAYPFRPHAVVFDLVNAWWLIEAATLAYSDPEFAVARFIEAKFDQVKYFSKNHTECYVAHNDAAAIVVFRGTESRGIGEGSATPDFTNVIQDIRTDAMIRLVDSGQGGKVHEGFKQALDKVWDRLEPHLAGLAQEGKKLWFTGHSLGAALATLAADRFGKVAGLYTFGSPRVGDPSFREDFWVPTYRFLNNNDIVGRVPTPPLYVHVGELKYIDRHGTIHENSWWWDRVVDGIAGSSAPFFNAEGKLRTGFNGLLPDAIVDHIPTLYATHIWNSLP
jgi:hypothetical protein